MEQNNDSKIEGNKFPKFVGKVSNEAKLKELLRNLSSTEIRISSYASKEFIKLLKGDDGGLLLREYVSSSSNCLELLQAWKLLQESSGSNYILPLISTFLSHPDGMYKANDTDPQRLAISKALDKLARSIIDKNLKDIYKELNSKDAKHQKAVLLLLAAIVRRGSSLASDVAKSFDFKLPVFIKLADYKQKKHTMKKKHSTRKPFVGFAMSFLEVGNPRLLRWVLQQREMYSVVLRGLGDDDEETIVYVLSTLRDKILVPESLIPPGLRSVLFGSVTLDRLINISSSSDGDVSAELAHSVLVAVCTDPSNGLMSDLTRQPSPLRGNPKRLLDLMKKLKATEVEYHRDLLLAIVKGRPSLACLYMDEYPYNLEDHASPSWFAAVSLAADLISSVGSDSPFSFIDSLHDCPSFNSSDVQCVMKCICPRPFTRLVINKGLLHPNPLVKHGSLKLVLEALKLLDSFMSFMDCKFDSDGQVKQRCVSLKIDIQNEARTLLPDPQVLLFLLSSLSSHCKSLGSCLKRKRGLKVVLEKGNNLAKKLKTDDADEDVDILVSGVGGSPEIDLPGDDAVVEEIKNVDDVNEMDEHMNVVSDIWGLHQCSSPTVAAEDEETYFYSKLLDTLRVYHRTVPAALEGSFDFFKVMPSDPLSLPIILQQSLLSLLVEVIGWSANREVPLQIPPMLYKHLQAFINMLLSSRSKEIKDQAYILAKAAILSTGAFTRNLREIDVWFLFLPNYSMKDFIVGDEGIEVLCDLFLPVVTFLCDAVSTIGNNPFKYWDLVKGHTNRLDGFEDASPEFSPLVVCVLEKCLRVLQSESGTFNISEKTVISLYVSNTVKFILQTQVKAGLISSLIDLLLSEKLGEHCSSDDSSQVTCEWQPLMNLLLFARDTASQKISNTSLKISDSSFVDVLSEVEKVLRSGSDSGLVKVTKAFACSLISTPSAVVLKHFPSVLYISRDLLGVPYSILLLKFSLEPNFMNDIFNLWPDMFKTGMQWAASGDHEEVDRDTHIDSITSASVEFSLFMRHAPCLVLMPMILSISMPELFEGPSLTTMLLSKLSVLSADKTISLIRLLLFWSHHIELNCSRKPLAIRESLFQVCSTLISQTLKVILKLTDSGCNSTPVTFLSQYMVEAAEVIYSHPLVLSSMECSVGSEREFPKAISGTNLEGFLHLTAKEMPYLNSAIFNFLPAFPENALEFVFQHKSLIEVGQSLENYKKSSIALGKRVLAMFRDRFGNFMESGDLKPLAPAFYVFHKLINIFSPKELFELVDWIFSRISLCDLAVHGSVEHSAMSFGLWIAGYAFDMLSAWLQQTHKSVSLYIKLWPSEVTSFDLPLFEKIYFRVVDIALQFQMEYADLCLLKAIDVAKILKVGNDRCISLSLDITKVILNTPIGLVSHFVKKTSGTRAKLLSSLIDISPVHLSAFGQLLSNMMREFVDVDGNVTKRTYESATLDSFLMFLPTAVSYLNSASVKQKELYRNCRDISFFYCTILLRSFSDWSDFVCQDLFRIEGNETLCLSVDDQFDLISGSLLTNTIFMLQNHFTSNKDAPLKPKKRLKLFNSVCSEFFSPDRDIGEVNVGVSLSLDSVNRILSKINFCKMLLFPKTNQTYLEVDPHKEDSSRIRFMKMLVGTRDWIASKYPFSSVNTQSRDLLKKLEAFLLQNILELTRAVGKYLTGQSIFTDSVEKLVRSVLLNRFDDPETLIMLRSIVISISDNKLHVSVLQLLLAHSQFASTIHSARKSHDGSQVGVTVKPMASILRFLVIPSADHNSNKERSQPLEAIKFLKALFSTVTQQLGFSFSKDIGVNSQELLFLLLSSYGATLGEIDLEIYKLMVILDSDKEMNSGSIAEMDFLWGSAANIGNDKEIPSDELSDIEAIEERRRGWFREKLPINPRICANTVLYFPYCRTVGDETLPDDISENAIKAPCWSSEKLQIYDPVYILRLSIHCLSMTYIEPVEFASLGLLSIVFVSISSPDKEMRKLGYEAIGRFKIALEKGQKRKETMRLRLLLMYIQNGIEESWQKIPSIIALFAAEASCILLDPVHDHYLTINKHLMHTPRVNMKSVPLFQSLLWSTTVTFKSDRLWMLRLLYAGLNSEEDCQLYVRNDISETLLGCYSSFPSDNEAKELILQVIKKSLKFHEMARYLVGHCGLISWLSSLVSAFTGIQFEDQRNLPLTLLVTVLEVANEVVAGDGTLEWLQKFAFEQLSELSMHVCKLLFGSILIQEHFNIVSSILKILTSTLKISQKRELNQTHFTLSIEAMFHICEAVTKCSDTMYCDTAEVLLTALLTSTPPVAILSMDEEKLMKILNWATSAAIQLDSAKVRPHQDNGSLQVIYSEEDHSKEDSMISKLLRWLTASVILQRQSNGSLGSKFSLERSEPKTLLSLLEHAKEQGEGLHTLGSGCGEILATYIFHLQQLLGTNYRLLPSVISAWCLLQFPDLSQVAAEIMSFPDYQNKLSSLLKRIHCPIEVNPDWRWSFDQQWEDISSKYTDYEKLDGLQACRSFLLIISNFIGYKKSLTHTLSLADVEKSGVYSWERSLLSGC